MVAVTLTPMPEWYVDQQRNAINWSAAMPALQSNIDVYRLVRGDEGMNNGDLGEHLFVWARAGQTVRAEDKAAALAVASSDPVPPPLIGSSTLGQGDAGEVAGSAATYATLPARRPQGQPLQNGDVAYLTADTVGTGTTSAPQYPRGAYMWDGTAWTLALGLGANLQFGTTAGTAAQGNDPRIVGALQAANNLSDLASAATARGALGLGTAAIQPAAAFDAAGAAAAAQAASLQKTANLSDLANPGTARGNLGLGTAATQPATAFSASPSTPVTSSATSGTLTAGAEHALTPATAAAWGLPTGVTSTTLPPTTVKNNGTATLTVARGGTDTISGGTGSISIAPGEWARFTSNGAGAWTQSGTAGQSGTYAPFAATRYGLATRSALAIGGDVDFSTSINDYCQHTPITLPVTTTRWRLRIRNTDGEFGTTVAAAFAFTGVWKGNPTVNADGTLAGTFTATPTKALNAFTTPSDGSEYVTSWVTDPTLQFAANTKSLIAWGWTCTASTSVARCHAQCWDTPHADRAGLASPTSLSAITLAFLEATVEYEYTGNSRVGLFIGDSLTEGQAASGHLLTYPMVYGRRSGDTAVLRAYPGAQTSAFTDPAAYKYTSLGLGTSIVPDYAVIWLGTNDISNSVATATIQANIGTVVANARSFGARRVYLATIIPRSWTGTQETARTTLNTWMQGLPFNTDGCFDFASLVASAADATVIATAYNSGDNIHLNGLGHMVLGNSVPILSAA